MKKLFLLLILPLFFFSNGQELNLKKASEPLMNYFNLDRENIYLHLNKTQYLTNETIFFKGYVLEKKEAKLNFQTTNVYLALLDENNNILSKHLFYAANGVVVGQLKINPNLPSGTYFIHTYTNYMNNFSENESTIQPLKILNIKDKIIPLDQSEKKTITINLSYEGGTFLAHTKNTIGVQIKNCLGNGLALNPIKVKNAQGEIVHTFSTNSQGYGKFDLLNTQHEIYTLETEYNQTTHQKLLELPKLEGLTLSINNYAFDQKSTITISTNEYGFKKYKDQKFSVLIQKNNLLNHIDFTLNAPQKEFVINQSSFFSGINCIRLVNENTEAISERIIYHQPLQEKITLQAKKEKDSLHINGTAKGRIANFSISILPEATESNFDEKSIYNSLAFHNYCTIDKINVPYYFDAFTKRKKYELDLVLLHAKSNYEWKNLLNNPPKETYNFDIGITIEGKINQNLKEKEKLKLRLYASNGINESIELDEKNEFVFNNVFAVDSTKFYFSLLKNDTQIKPLNVTSRVTNNDKSFLKSLNLTKPICKAESFVKKDSDAALETTLKATYLKEIELTKEVEIKLTNENEYNNSMAKGYKINPSDVTSYRDVLSFIASHGYDVSTEGGSVTIRARASRSILGTLSPAVFLDNGPVTDFSFLTNIQLYDVDEIYINKHGYGMGMIGSNGVIRIYTKKTYETKVSPIEIKSKSIDITNAFQKVIAFKTDLQQDFSSAFFKKNGTIAWIPNLYSDENGAFEFKIPTLGQDKIRVILQGIDNYGSLYYETIVLEIK